MGALGIIKIEGNIMTTKKILLELLDKKIEEGKQLHSYVDSIYNNNYYEEPYLSLLEKYSKWIYSTIALFKKIPISEKEPIVQFKIYNNTLNNILMNERISSNILKIERIILSQISIIKGIKEIYEEIEPIDLKLDIAKGLYDDELVVAKEFLNDGHIIPSAMLMRSVLENALNLLIEKHNIEVKGSGIKNKAIALRKAGIISKLEEKNIEVWAFVGNDAAHNGGKEITNKNVEDAITGVSNFIERFELKN
jgi:hypothetical protein